jgi:hypothetical protein
MEHCQAQAGVAMHQHHSVRVTPSVSSGRNTQSDTPTILMPAYFIHHVSKPAGNYCNRIQYEVVYKGLQQYVCHIGPTTATMSAYNFQQTSV